MCFSVLQVTVLIYCNFWSRCKVAVKWLWDKTWPGYTRLSVTNPSVFPQRQGWPYHKFSILISRLFRQGLLEPELCVHTFGQEVASKLPWRVAIVDKCFKLPASAEKLLKFLNTLILGIDWKCMCFEYHLTFVELQGWSGFTRQSVECFMVRIFYRAATERQASGNNFANIPNTKVQLKSSFS